MQPKVEDWEPLQLFQVILESPSWMPVGKKKSGKQLQHREIKQKKVVLFKFNLCGKTEKTLHDSEYSMEIVLHIILCMQ